MAEDVFNHYKRKLRRKKKRKYRPTNDYMQEEKKAFTQGDKFWKLFQACETEIEHTNTPDVAHFCLKVERLSLHFQTEPSPETETRLHLEVKEHIIACLNNDSHPVGNCLKKFTNLFHATYARSEREYKRTAKVEELKRKESSNSAQTVPSLSIGKDGSPLGFGFSSDNLQQQHSYSPSCNSAIIAENRTHFKKHKYGVQDVQRGCERFMGLLLALYPPLNESCLYFGIQQALHIVIFPSLEPTLVDLYRNRLKDAELLFIENCKNMRHYPLTSFGVNEKFLLRRACSETLIEEETPEPVVDEIRSMEREMKEIKYREARKPSQITEIIRPPTCLFSEDIDIYENQLSLPPNTDFHSSQVSRSSVPISIDNYSLLEAQNLLEEGGLFSDDSLKVSSISQELLSELSSEPPKVSASKSPISFHSSKSTVSSPPRSRKSTLTANLRALQVNKNDGETLAQQLTNTCREAYRPAFEIFYSFENCTTPNTKLALVKKIVNTICECVDRCYENEIDEKIRISTDELIILFAYVIIQSQCVTILSDLEFVEDFSSNKIRNGMDEYYLSTMRAAAKLLSSPQSQCLIVDKDF